MAVYMVATQWKKLETDIAAIFADQKRKGNEELLVNDVCGALMMSMRGGIVPPDGVQRWKGLTAQDIGYAPEGAKYRSDIEWLGNFEKVLESFGYTTRYEKHGAGNKCLARAKENEELKRSARRLIDSEYDCMEGFESEDLWDYLASAIPGLSRKQSDELYSEMF